MGLKRNSKGELAEVTPLRSRKGSIYIKGSNEKFKISRSKFSNFLDCKRCFYLERVKGLKDPGMPGWSLNSAVDELLKKEFDKLDKSDPNKTFHNFAIGDGEEKILNICSAAGMSSFLEPDMEYLSKFHFFDKHSKIIKKEKVKTKKLATIKENIDFLKIDVQGYESEIISHNKDKIKTISDKKYL